MGRSSVAGEVSGKRFLNYAGGAAAEDRTETARGELATGGLSVRDRPSEIGALRMHRLKGCSHSFPTAPRGCGERRTHQQSGVRLPPRSACGCVDEGARARVQNASDCPSYGLVNPVVHTVYHGSACVICAPLQDLLLSGSAKEGENNSAPLRRSSDASSAARCAKTARRNLWIDCT